MDVRGGDYLDNLGNFRKHTYREFGVLSREEGLVTESLSERSVSLERDWVGLCLGAAVLAFLCNTRFLGGEG